MESRAKLLGHSIHPMLVVLAAWIVHRGGDFDGVYLWRGNATFAAVAYWNIAGGIVGGLLAAVFWPRRDWLAIPGGTRQNELDCFMAAPT